MEKNEKTEKPSRRRRNRPKPPSQPTDDFISPLDFLDMDVVDDQETESKEAVQEGGVALKHQGLFIVGTDVSVGKTIAICTLAALLKEKKVDVAIVKPIDCGTEDIPVFRDACNAGTVSSAVGLYSFREKITPYFAFRKAAVEFDMQKTVDLCRGAINDHELTLVEGPGGFYDPLSDAYTVADLIRQLNVKVVIVAPLQRGTMNHLLMIARQARDCGIEIQGVLLTEKERSKPQAYFLAKVQAIRDLAKLKVLGIIPFLEKGDQEEVLAKCHQKVSFKLLLDFPLEDSGAPVEQPEPGEAPKEGQTEEGQSPQQPAKRRSRSSRSRRRKRAVRQPE